MDVSCMKSFLFEFKLEFGWVGSCDSIQAIEEEFRTDFRKITQSMLVNFNTEIDTSYFRSIKRERERERCSNILHCKRFLFIQ